MTRRNVDGDDMLPQDPLDEETLEAFLSGRSRPGELAESLAAFSQDVEAVVSGRAPEPTGNLAALLRDGFSVNGAAPRATQSASGLVTTPSPAALPEAWAPVPRPLLDPPPPAAPSTSPRRRSLKLIPRLAGLGLAAKVGLGLGVAAASVTGAGAAGVLPDPAQDVVASVVDTVTPFHIPDPSHGRSSPDRPGAGTSGKVGGQGVPGGGNGITGDVEGPAGVGAGGAPGVGPSAGGSTGLNRANETPAAGNVPNSLPVPTTTFSSAQTGLDRANETPAAGNVPTSVPVPTTVSPGQKGLDRAGETPAAEHLPTTTSTTTTLAP